MASPEVYSVVAGVTDFQGPNGQRQVIDKTTLADTTRQKEVGIADMGQITMNLVYDGDEATNTTLWDLFQSGALNNFQVIFNDSPQEVFSFAGYVLQYQYQASIDDVVRASVTIEISGNVTDNNA